MRKDAFLILKEYFCIAAGSFLLAFGLIVFLVPGKLSSGGVSTVGTVLLYLTDIPIFVTTLVLNAILFVFGWRFLGKKSIFKTVAGILFSSLFLALCAHFPVYTEDILLAALLGGVFIGLGIGLAIRQEASTGGSDFAALILNRLIPHISVSHWILFIDCGIIALAGLVFGSITVTLYSAIALLVSMKAADLILTFGDAAKSVFVLSPKAKEISACIQTRFARGTTGIYSKGMYTGQNSLMLLSVVSPKELPVLIHLIRSKDHNAFIIVSDVREVLGEGFKKGTAYDAVRDDKKK